MELIKKAIKWIDNFWYHYKWTTIIVVFFAVVTLVFVGQTVTSEPDDGSILYVGPCILTANQRLDIESAFVAVMDHDYDENGKKSALLYDLPAFTDEQADEARKKAEAEGGSIVLNEYLVSRVQNKISYEIMGGENYICMLDPYWYDLLLENGAILRLEDVLGETPELSADGFGVRLKDLDFGSYFSAFSYLPDDTVLCMRVVSVANTAIGNSGEGSKYEISKEIFRDIFDFTAPEQ